ncbi:hypothetical protein H0H81_000846 [Sphagnurus paluster]|uniref:DUF6593 domain-containing protein n=1 Tax=Sphagnurus paluster TaxID=117069 RepID=A0A9P7FSX4_9AGAR|nr:hypothetical protein H0H81_000846 [Sphagnurus paluster]
MSPPPPPYILEDRTGSLTHTDFDDLYDRIFFHISRAPANGTTTIIYNMNVRGSPHRDGLPFHGQPVVLLKFPPDERLGTITYLDAQQPQTMQNYLRKSAMFGSSLFRKFTASDGREYQWGHHMFDGQEWSCLVAHFDVKPPDARPYDPQVSGNYLTIYEQFFPLTLELLASLMIMRHIKKHHL